MAGPETMLWPISCTDCPNLLRPLELMEAPVHFLYWGHFWSWWRCVLPSVFSLSPILTFVRLYSKVSPFLPFLSQVTACLFQSAFYSTLAPAPNGSLLLLRVALNLSIFEAVVVFVLTTKSFSSPFGTPAPWGWGRGFPHIAWLLSNLSPCGRVTTLQRCQLLCTQQRKSDTSLPVPPLEGLSVH